MRILVVKDETKLAGFIKSPPPKQLYAMDVAYEGKKAFSCPSGTRMIQSYWILWPPIPAL